MFIHRYEEAWYYSLTLDLWLENELGYVLISLALRR